MRALVVEDEKRLARNVADGLRQGAGYAVDVADNGESGLFMAESNEYDLAPASSGCFSTMCTNNAAGETCTQGEP